MKATFTYRVEYFLRRLHFKLLKRKAAPFFFFLCSSIMKICMVRCISHHMLTANCIWNGKYQLNQPFWTAWWQLPCCWMLTTLVISTDLGPCTGGYETLSSHLNTGLASRLRSSFPSLRTKMFTGKAFSSWPHSVASTPVLVLFNGFKTLHKLVEGHNDVGTWGHGKSGLIAQISKNCPGNTQIWEAGDR